MFGLRYRDDLQTGQTSIYKIHLAVISDSETRASSPSSSPRSIPALDAMVIADLGLVRSSQPEDETVKAGYQLKLEIKAGSTTCTDQVFGVPRCSFFLPLRSLHFLLSFE